VLDEQLGVLQGIGRRQMRAGFLERGGNVHDNQRFILHHQDATAVDMRVFDNTRPPRG
jgi:hypothetical protein